MKKLFLLLGFLAIVGLTSMTVKPTKTFDVVNMKDLPNAMHAMRCWTCLHHWTVMCGQVPTTCPSCGSKNIDRWFTSMCGQ